jgi:PAS domain S-box-containing protein
MDPADSHAPARLERDVLITTSLDGRVLGWSRGAQALFGWRELEILGRPVTELVHEKHRSIDEQTVAEARAGRSVRDAIVKFVRRDGAALACMQTLVPMRDATGRVSAVVRIVFDLTSLREAERSLRRMRAQIDELAGPSGVGERMASSELARTVRDERERTRRQFLRVVGGEARQLAEELVSGLAAAAESAAAGRRGAAELAQA